MDKIQEAIEEEVTRRVERIVADVARSARNAAYREVVDHLVKVEAILRDQSEECDRSAPGSMIEQFIHGQGAGYRGSASTVAEARQYVQWRIS